MFKSSLWHVIGGKSKHNNVEPCLYLKGNCRLKFFIVCVAEWRKILYGFKKSKYFSTFDILSKLFERSHFNIIVTSKKAIVVLFLNLLLINYYNYLSLINNICCKIKIYFINVSFRHNGHFCMMLYTFFYKFSTPVLHLHSKMHA